jgi:hypothetical protein
MRKLFLLISLFFIVNSSAESSVVHSTSVATALILMTQVGIYLYYAQKGSLAKFIFHNKGALIVYTIVHCVLNYCFFSILKRVKYESHG